MAKNFKLARLRAGQKTLAFDQRYPVHSRTVACMDIRAELQAVSMLRKLILALKARDSAG